jgi:hypothetical protein
VPRNFATRRRLRDRNQPIPGSACARKPPYDFKVGFELTFLTAGPDSQTLVVALYYAVFAAGVRAPQSIDAMAMVYMAVTLVWLLIALMFVDPTQLVSRVRS